MPLAGCRLPSARPTPTGFIFVNVLQVLRLVIRLYEGVARPDLSAICQVSGRCFCWFCC